MKRKTVILSLILAASMLLAACSTNCGEDITLNAALQEPTDTEETADNAESAEASENTEETAETENTEEAENAEEDDFEERTTVTDKSKFPTDIYGMLEDNISPDEMTLVRKYSEESSWSYITCEGFVYMAEPTGISCNSIDDADIFNGGDNSFAGIPDSSTAVFKRINAGDEICGLTVDTAVTAFRNEAGVYPDDCKIRYFGGCAATFKGEKEMSGYIVILSDDEYGVGGVGDIVFIPDGESQTLPVMNYTAIEQNDGGKWQAVSKSLKYTLVEGGLAFKNEYGIIHLGNTADYGDMLDGAEQNTPLKASLTVGDITMDSDIEWFVNIYAVIKELKLN
ncbi:MAG: hypothetical protein NC203_07115 [Firmicutes bacterium]|nr:hypothetical protein [[Eubacterium] siraeum]MCM1488119.1 hypothetical protein [Bacillota bacterium]